MRTAVPSCARLGDIDLGQFAGSGRTGAAARTCAAASPSLKQSHVIIKQRATDLRFETARAEKFTRLFFSLTRVTGSHASSLLFNHTFPSDRCPLLPTTC